MKRLLFTSLYLLFSLIIAPAQSNYWEEALGPYGGYFPLTKTNDGTLYAVSNLGKALYRSNDGGYSWQELPDILGNSLGNTTFHIGKLGNFYLRNGANWYKSSDEGITWEQMNNSANQLEKFVETSTGTLVGYNYGYFFTSTNGGQNWAQTSDYPSVDDRYLQYLKITPFGGLLAEASIYTGDSTRLFYHSTDDGQSWQRIEVDADFSGLFIAPSGTIFTGTSNPAGLYRSTDSGLTFSPADSLSVYQNNDYFTALPGGRLLFISNGQLYFSDDDGITWQPSGVKYGSWWGFQPIEPLSDGAIFSTILKALYKSNDGGLTWQFSATGIRGGTIWKMRFITDSTYYASTETGLWETADAGQNWNKLTDNKTIQNGGYFGITSSGGVVAIEDDKVLWSATGDVPFVDITPPDSLQTGINLVFVNPLSDHIFINTKNGFSRSANFGQQWTQVLDSAYLNAIDFHPSGRIIGVLNYTRIVVSDDEGLTWDTVFTPNVLALGGIRIAPDGDVYVIAVLNNNTAVLLKSEDAGNSWTTLAGDIGSIHFWTDNLLAVAANGHIFRSDGHEKVFLSANKGVSWQSIPGVSDNPGLSYLTNNISISPGQYLYLDTDWGLFRSLDPVSQGAYITGYVRRDADADCSTPDAQEPLKNWIVEAAGNFDYYTRTDPTGRYTFFLDTGAYAVSVSSPNMIWWGLCDSTQSIAADSLFATDTLDFAAFALAECPLISVDAGFLGLRRCFDNTAFVQYCNVGSEPADSARVDVELDPYLSLVSSAQPYNDLGNNIFRFFIDNVESGECGQFSFVVHVDCDSTVLGQTHCIAAHAYPDTLCTSIPGWSGATIEAEVECQDTSVQLRLRNTGTAPSQMLDYIIIEDDVVLMSGEKQYNSGETLTMSRPANGSTWRIESQQEPGHPFSNVAVAFTEGCGGFGSLGFINQFNVNTFQPSYDQVCRENTGAFDPNDKQGFPLGFGTQHRIRPGQELEYLIRFQNTGTDTAFTIVIFDTLSPRLDPASVRPGASSHPYSWELSGQGVVSFTFSNILLPDSNINEAASHGFVSFRIAQRPDVPAGAQIFNEAAIYFDFNAPVITNQTLHTVGADYLTGTHSPKGHENQNTVVVSPNPVAESAVFQLKTGNFRQHRLTLSDAFGRQVREVEISGEQYLFQRKGLPAGIYFFLVDDAKAHRVDGGKIILH